MSLTIESATIKNLIIFVGCGICLVVPNRRKINAIHIKVVQQNTAYARITIINKHCEKTKVLGSRNLEDSVLNWRIECDVGHTLYVCTSLLDGHRTFYIGLCYSIAKIQCFVISIFGDETFLPHFSNSYKKVILHTEGFCIYKTAFINLFKKIREPAYESHLFCNTLGFLRIFYGFYQCLLQSSREIGELCIIKVIAWNKIVYGLST